MEQTGGLTSLAERLREKTEQERIQTEKVFAEQLQTLSSNLQASSENALRTMSDAMAQEITNAAENLNHHYNLLSLAFGKKWVSTAVLGMALCMGLFFGGWMLAKLAALSLEDTRSKLAHLKAECQTQRETLDILNSETWGITLNENSKGRFIVVPVGMKINPSWTMGDRQAIRLE